LTGPRARATVSVQRGIEQGKVARAALDLPPQTRQIKRPSGDEGTGAMATDEAIRGALAQGHTIDITTTGRRSGEPRRKEIVFHTIDGRLYISGRPFPKKRDWLLNLEADPRMTFHLKDAVHADLPATARVITDEAERRTILAQVARNWQRDDLDAMISYSPLIEVTLDGLTP
jgi:deazaflavin-dependent oxidoreductase (nitroreductase family)